VCERLVLGKDHDLHGSSIGWRRITTCTGLVWDGTKSEHVENGYSLGGCTSLSVLQQLAKQARTKSVDALIACIFCKEKIGVTLIDTSLLACGIRWI
jgi:hypothetical protein